LNLPDELSRQLIGKPMRSRDDFGDADACFEDTGKKEAGHPLVVDIEIHKQCSFPGQAELARDIERERRFADPAFAAGDR
jgi:hypothetical protein